MTMNEKHMRELRRQVFRKNPGIDPRLVEKHECLERVLTDKLARVGVQSQLEYGLEPPSGREERGYRFRG